MRKVSVLLATKDLQVATTIAASLGCNDYQLHTCQDEHILYGDKSLVDSSDIMIFDLDFFTKVAPHKIVAAVRSVSSKATLILLFGLQSMSEVEGIQKSAGKDTLCLPKNVEAERVLAICEKIRLRGQSEQKEPLWPEISQIVDDFLQDYTKKLLEKELWAILPKMAEDLLKKEIGRIGREVSKGE